MDPILLQKQVRDNAQGLQEFCKELKEWGAEMKKKDESLKSTTNDTEEIPKNKLRKTSESAQPVKTTKKSKRLKGCDYAAWEKFDAEAYCAKVDGDKTSSDESELSDEIDVGMLDLANAEKEKGNAFVKRQRWDDAVKCYTKAVEYYAYDPIYYANRALCHLKKLSYRDAESDCTTALQLDKTYVKAYQRRAVARENLNQLADARSDYLRIFELEPNNKESKAAFAKLEKKLSGFEKPPQEELEGPRPVSKFTLSRQNQNKLKSEHEIKPPSSNSQKVINAIQEHVVERIRPTSNTNQSTTDTIADVNKKLNESCSTWPSGEKTQLFESIDKPPKLRSKTPLKRIKIIDVDTNSELDVQDIAKRTTELENNSRTTSILSDKLIELRNSEDLSKQKELDDFVNKKLAESEAQQANSFDELKLPVPKNSVQFYNAWRTIKNNSEWQFMYLKRIPPGDLPVIFKDSLESRVFSDIVKILSVDFVRDCGHVLHSYLLHLSRVKRFSALIMFMTSDDKKCVSKIFHYLKQDGETEELVDLFKRYEMYLD